MIFDTPFELLRFDRTYGSVSARSGQERRDSLRLGPKIQKRAVSWHTPIRKVSYKSFRANVRVDSESELENVLAIRNRE